MNVPVLTVTKSNKEIESNELTRIASQILDELFVPESLLYDYLSSYSTRRYNADTRTIEACFDVWLTRRSDSGPYEVRECLPSHKICYDGTSDYVESVKLPMKITVELVTCQYDKLQFATAGLKVKLSTILNTIRRFKPAKWIDLPCVKVSVSCCLQGNYGDPTTCQASQLLNAVSKVKPDPATVTAPTEWFGLWSFLEQWKGVLLDLDVLETISREQVCMLRVAKDTFERNGLSDKFTGIDFASSNYKIACEEAPFMDASYDSSSFINDFVDLVPLRGSLVGHPEPKQFFKKRKSK